MTHFIKPQWPAPSSIKAFSTLRTGGVSEPPFEALNLGTHVGDNPENVKENRTLLKKILALPGEPTWLTQTHSTNVIDASNPNQEQEADGSFTNQAKKVCVVLTADCLPLLFAHRKGQYVSAVHAGWRGLANGIIGSVVKTFTAPAKEMLVWLGPGISSANYEVGDEVRALFMEKDPDNRAGFLPSPNGRWLANLYTLARLQLQKHGITAIYGGNHCTYADKRFYSARRDGNKTGRMASLIWIE